MRLWLVIHALISDYVGKRDSCLLQVEILEGDSITTCVLVSQNTCIIATKYIGKTM